MTAPTAGQCEVGVLICGVNVTHDGCIAVIDNNRLLFSVEVEKVDNGRRYSALGGFERIGQILAAEGLDPARVDSFVLDGWYEEDGATSPNVVADYNGAPLRLPVAPYIDQGIDKGPLQRYVFDGVPGTCLAGGYASYAHATTHVLGAYCSSPFAGQQQNALVMTWDGGMLPRLYSVEPQDAAIKFLGPLFPLMGYVFVEFCMALKPFRDDSLTSGLEMLQHNLETAGKAMAYAALGTIEPDLFPRFDRLFDVLADTMHPSNPSIGRVVAERTRDAFPGMSSADLIATFQAYIGKMLVDGFARVLHRRFGSQPMALCMSGGCALNIKWNSALRDSGMFSSIWIPPFPNDSGAALGTACCEMVHRSGRFELEWDVYSGPSLETTACPQGWSARPCDERQLATLLHEQGEPVVVLHGRAELGPRALGNRSILAPAVRSGMKDELNRIKGRANYRPVAPICLESRAHEVFDPGTPDPYMLFDHQLRQGWGERIPAIVHLDGSARLQTIGADQRGTATRRILEEYAKLSGIPVLCNTSANLSGRGFFPNAESAAQWGGTKYVWANGVLYSDPRRA